MKKAISPMLAATALAPFTRPGWIYEPKFDGIRALAKIENGAVKISSRNGLDLNHRFPDLVRDLAKNKNMIIDGEIVALDSEGKPSFQLLQQQNTQRQQRSNTIKRTVVYYVFDMLFDGADITEKPLSERKRRLSAKLRQTASVRLVKEIPTTGEAAFQSCLKHGLEGIIAKQKYSMYQMGKRSSNWVKIKGNHTAEFAIGGYTDGTGSRASTFGSLLLGYFDGKGEFRYVGGVGTGFDDATLNILTKCMKSLKSNENPFNVIVKGKGKPHWVIPHLVAEIQFAEMTQDGILRLPVFLRLRDDITAEEAGPRTMVSPPRRRKDRREFEAMMNHGA